MGGTWTLLGSPFLFPSLNLSGSVSFPLPAIDIHILPSFDSALLEALLWSVDGSEFDGLAAEKKSKFSRLALHPPWRE